MEDNYNLEDEFIEIDDSIMEDEYDEGYDEECDLTSPKPNLNLLGIEVTDQEFDFLMCEQAKGKELKVVDGKVIAVERVKTQAEINMARIIELKNKLKETDYQAIKHFEGCLSDSEYEPIKTQRQAWRDEINELEEQIK